MKNYIFLTNQYLPKPGATGLCIHQLAKKLVENGENVYTICYADGDLAKEYDGVKVVKISIPSFLNDNQSASNLKRKLQYSMSLWSKLIHLHDYPLRSNKLIDEYVNAVKKLLKRMKNATIIASYTPLEAVVAAAKIKKQYPDRVKIAYYSADTLSNEQGDAGILPSAYRTKLGVKWEKKLFELYDKVFIMECHKKYYFRRLNKFKNKYEIVSFPLLSKVNTTNGLKKGDKLSLVYAGSLYQQLRNPSILNKILVELSKTTEFDAIFLGGGDCEEIMKNAEKESKGAIKYLGMQPHDVAMEYIAAADILLSIGNEESPMAPSKIYEYMSTGKPIIHIYTYEKDPCLLPLKSYKNALLVDANSKPDIISISNFIEHRKTLEYESVRINFKLSTPEYTIKMIENM